MTEIVNARIYQHAPPDQVARLAQFRQSHPYRTLTIEGVSWRYLASGQGDHTVLLLPGAFARADMWFTLIEVLERDYRCLAIDSFTLQGVFDMAAICRALSDILTYEGAATATIIGLSAGGGIAQLFIQQYPDRVDHLVLSHTGVYDPDRARAAARMLPFVRVLPTALLRRIIRRQTGGHYPESSTWRAFASAYVREMSQNIHRATVISFFKTSQRVHSEYVHDAAAIDAWPGRTLILSSRDDDLSRDSAAKLERRYPHSHTHYFEAGGHHTFLLFPEVYAHTIKSFLERALAAPAPAEQTAA